MAGAVVRPSDPPTGRGGAPGLQRGPRAGHRRPADAAGSCGGSVPLLRRGRARPVRPGRHAIGRPDDLVVDVVAGTFGDRLEQELRSRPRPHGRPLAAVDDAVDRRRLAGLPGRRPAVEPLRQDRGPRRRPRRRARRRHRAPHRRARRARPSAPTSPSSSSAPRAPSASSPAPGCGPGPCPRADHRRRLRLRRLRRRGRRLPPHRPARAPPPPRSASTTRSRPTAASAPATAPSCSCSTRAIPWSSTPPRRITDDECAGGRASSTTRSSSAGSATATTSPRSRRSISAGYVVDTMEITASWSSLPTVYAERPRRHRRGARRARLVGPPVAQLPRRRLPLLHLRRPARRRPIPRPATPSTSRAGTPAPAPCSPTAARSATTTASASTGRRFVREALGDRVIDLLGATQADASTRTASSTRASSASRHRSARHPFHGSDLAASRARRPPPLRARPPPLRARPPPRGTPVNQYDRQAILAGAIAGLFFALPAAVLQRTVFDDTRYGRGDVGDRPVRRGARRIRRGPLAPAAPARARGPRRAVTFVGARGRVRRRRPGCPPPGGADVRAAACSRRSARSVRTWRCGRAPPACPRRRRR